MRSLLRRLVLAALAGVALVVGTTWYASVHRHLPEQWPRVYVASNCPASEFALMVAEEHEGPIVTIPVDDGELSERACRHARGLLQEHSAWWFGLGVLPESLVCSRMIRDGATWMMDNRHDEWPVFVGPDGGVHRGADIEGLRTAGLEIGEDEYAVMLERFGYQP